MRARIGSARECPVADDRLRKIHMNQTKRRRLIGASLRKLSRSENVNWTRRVKSLGAWLAALLLCCALSAPVAAQELKALTPEAVGEIADRHFGKAAESGRATVVTVVKDGQVVLMKGYGTANPKTGTPVD